MTKTTLLKLHRWVGLALAVLLFVQGLSGTLLVFRDEIDRLILPELTVSPAEDTVPVQQMIAALQDALADAKLKRAVFPERPDEAVIFRLQRDGENYLAAVDPHSGAVLRQGPLTAWPSEWIFRLHDDLLAGETGNYVVGAEGVGLLFLLVVGLYVWWPGRKRLRSGFRLMRGSGAERYVRSLHRAAGAAVAAILLVSATTGALMVFKVQAAPVAGMLGPMVDRPKPSIDYRPGAPLLPVDRLIEAARQRSGKTELRELRFLGKQGQVVAVYLADREVLRENAVKMTFFNGYDGTLLATYFPTELPATSTFFDWLYPVHTGKALPYAGRLLIFTGGVSLVFFAVSGAWLWYVRTRARARRRRAKQAAA